MLHLLLGDVPAERVPRHGGHSDRRSEDTAKHCADALRVPAVVLREGPGGEPTEVGRGRVSGGVPGDRLAQRLALVEHELGDRIALLSDSGRLEERDGETDFQMPFDVA